MEVGHTLLSPLEKPKGKRPRGRSKITWEDKIIWDLKEVDYEGDWKILAQDMLTWRVYEP